MDIKSHKYFFLESLSASRLFSHHSLDMQPLLSTFFEKQSLTSFIKKKLYQVLVSAIATKKTTITDRKKINKI